MYDLRNVISYYILEIAFKYDKMFLCHLSMNEDEWSKLDLAKWKVFNLMYRAGAFVSS
jgi:hypothetical protein